MLAIRMQRTGRKGHASFRVVVQDSSQTPSSGKVVAQIGTYDPHSKATVIDKEKASFYLTNGAQPSPRVAVLLAKEGVKLPTWVEKKVKKSSIIRHPEKLRRNRPAEEKALEVEDVEVPEVAEAATEAPVPEVTEAPTEDATTPEVAETVSEVVTDEAAAEATEEPAPKA